ncbi:LLM class flavin-dependent oxidoreductase [Streptomyces sp. NPDC058217]|uniref:LLM class flavin-dependent oxidoreductase n=1 Tax=Streptomyces sp. NPDC058217 TaxID=3346384 RepID=UPI0036ED4EC4
MAPGLAAGWNERESGAHGIEVGTHRQRSDRFEEACQVLIGLLSPQETITFKGSCYELTDARSNPKPVQQPHPPICIGSSGEKRTLRTAARCTQDWNFDSGTPERFSGARDVLHQHCTDVGRDPAEIPLSGQVQFTGDSAATAATAAAPHAAGRGSRSSTCVRRTHRPHWSRWPERCRSCAEAARSPCPSATERLLKRAQSRVTRRGD